MNTPLSRFVPIVDTLRSYQSKHLRGDISAGLTTAVMLIPQGMGYAMLAGLPPIYGLYSSLVPIVMYSLFGTSRQLAVGPVAMVSLLVAAGVGALAAPATEAFIAYAILLALMVGALQLAMGVARLGFLVNFLSHPVISGFTSAAALIIGFSQLKHLLGLKIPRSNYVHTIILGAVERIESVNPYTLLVGGLSIAILVLLKRIRPRWPRALLVVVASSLGVWLTGLDKLGVNIVGSVPAGLPAFALPTFDLDAIVSLTPIALAIALVGFMESIAVAKRFARENKYNVDANQELVGLGIANLLGAFFKATPVTGGFSRTAVNAQAGAQTGVAGLITAFVIGLTLLFLTPLFYYLPQAVLAAIIVTAVAGLIDLHEVAHLWRVKRTDLAMLALTFAATLSLGIEEGIAVGVGASLLVFVFRTTRPHVAVLGHLPATEVYRNVKRFPEAQTIPGVLMIRLDAQFYFGNVNFLKETLVELEQKQAEPLRAVIIDASGINQIDASAESALREIYEDYTSRGIRLLLASVKGPVRDVLERSGLSRDMGANSVMFRVHDAVQYLSATAGPPSASSESASDEAAA